MIAVGLEGGFGMAEHPNVRRIREAVDAYNSGDLDAMRPHLAEDIVWHVGGDHPLSGTYRGHEEVFGYYSKVQSQTGGTLTIEPLEILANDRHGAIFMRVTGDRDGKSIDVELAEALALDSEGRWSEYWALADDQASVDAFWR
jgi:uncharacterized protein